MQSYRQLTGTALLSELRCGRVPRWLQEWRGFEASQRSWYRAEAKDWEAIWVLLLILPRPFL